MHCNIASYRESTLVNYLAVITLTL